MQQKVKGVCRNWAKESTIIGASFNPRSRKDERKKKNSIHEQERGEKRTLLKSYQRIIILKTALFSDENVAFVVY